jgi:hypothetical protein
MKIAVIIGGWYFPAHLYENVIKAKKPVNIELDYFVVSHRNPSFVDISNEMIPRIKNNNIYDIELYSKISTYQNLKDMGYQVNEVSNLVGDYFFFNQWADFYNYKDYNYVLFMHDDNYLLPDFKNIFIDIFEKETLGVKFINGTWLDCSIKNFDYIANSAGGSGKTARGSFSIWSKKFLDKLGGSFSIKGVTLTRENKFNTPNGHLEMADWNHIGRNLQEFVEENGMMESTYRLSKYYRISKYMIEGERGLISKVDVLEEELKKGYKKYIK